MSLVAYGYAIVPVGITGTLLIEGIAVEVESVALKVELVDTEITVEVP